MTGSTLNLALQLVRRQAGRAKKRESMSPPCRSCSGTQIIFPFWAHKVGP